MNFSKINNTLIRTFRDFNQYIGKPPIFYANFNTQNLKTRINSITADMWGYDYTFILIVIGQLIVHCSDKLTDIERKILTNNEGFTINYSSEDYLFDVLRKIGDYV